MNQPTLTKEQTDNIMWLVNKLTGLNIDAKFSHLENGPIVSGYYFLPGHSTPVKKLMNLSEDLALSIGADKVDVQRLGGFIVVFVPNKERKVVEYKDLLYWYMHDSDVEKMEIALPIGVTHRGQKVAFDLTEMPHILMAGSTGSGKSVAESSIISSLAYKYSPTYLHLYLVDTKRVDLPLFKQLPHVMKVAEDLQTFHEMMQHIMEEIRRRLNMLAGVSCRNIKEYHAMGLDMPYIVIMLDEFGDLMELDDYARKAGLFEDVPRVRSWIKQAVQIGRAAGVHLICCTQRSSVKVVDGDIKANLPCRIALRLPTGTDSRTILGYNGAENLLGKGDMLVQRSDVDVPQRYHGPLVEMKDITQLVVNYEYIKDSLR